MATAVHSDPLTIALEKVLPENKTPARGSYCAKCTCCPVARVGDLCCFCEDGELCPRQKMKQRQKSTEVQVNKVRADLEKQIFDLTSALVNQGWKAARAKGVAAKVIADDPDASFDSRFRRIMSGNWGADLAPVKQAAPKQAVKEEPVPKKLQLDIAQYQKLVAKGLDQRAIAAEMGIGYSTLSTKLGQARRAGELSDAPPENRKPRAAKKTNGHAAEPTPAINGKLVPHRHPMLVTPEFLDRFWAALPLEEKVRILERV